MPTHLVLLLLSTVMLVQAGEPFRSPQDVAFSPDGARLAVGDATAGNLVLIDATSGKPGSVIALKARPYGVVWHGDRIFVGLSDRGAVAVVNPSSGAVERTHKVGGLVMGLAVSPDGSRLVVCDGGRDRVLLVKAADGQVEVSLPSLRRPRAVAIAPDGKLALVANGQPDGDARSSEHAATVTLVDLVAGNVAASIRLPSGSVNLRAVAFSADGAYAYVTHTLGRFTLPTTQLERGWVNTNAVSVIAIAERRVYATVLLDTISRGAADPWGLALSPDGAKAWVAIAGIPEVVELDLKRLHLLLAGKAAKEDLAKIPADSVWHRIVSAKDPKAADEQRSSLANDLAALYLTGASRRLPIRLVGARGVAVSAKQVAVAGYFSGTILLAAHDQLAAAEPIALGPQPALTRERRGEQKFFSGEHCFQNWLSCGTCHPEGRADGLNWDLLNDGMGNPKNTKTMVWADRTPPMMWTGVRENMEQATQKGFMVIQFRDVTDADLEDVRSYLRSLDRSPSPYLVDGKLSPLAQRGEKLFNSPKIGCAGCHTPPLYTNLKRSDVGTSHELDQGVTAFDTPQLVDVWATAPYLHDGRARSLLDVLTTSNPADKHGHTTGLPKEDLEALVEYLNSL